MLKMTLESQSSIGPGLFKKVEKWRDFFLKFSNFLENDSGRGSCPSSLPSGNQVDGSPLVAIPNRSVLKRPAAAKIRHVGREYLDLNDTSHLGY